jgi:hypothetical protein
VNDSRITGNTAGILLTDAGDVTASGDILTGNGYAAYNANADNSAVREGAPFTLSRSYFGTSNPPVSGPDTTGAATVVLTKSLSSAPRTVPTGVGRVADHDPTAEVADPGRGQVFEVGTAVRPLITGTDDFAIKSATLFVNGSEAGTVTTAPYLFDWTPTLEEAGKKVTFRALVVDSSGNAKLSRPVTYPVAPVTPPPTIKINKVETSRDGTATVSATVNTAGTVTLSGDKVVTVTKKVTGGCAVTLTVTAAPEYRATLIRNGKLDVDVTLTFTNAAGKTATQTVEVTLVKK